ncbi:uncharacterized protein LOC123315642 isoform X2 [Coccinella septempunctata]|uniref:uncharacterized protein LOC123315642 isoform X2 n=1 Tax=Coccinella septempunctata TaxID=41139 RepID=UPI001D094C06|nr:uncharacterized protein LOC123315642 isoform X2 [Coccinella septempunctata]
MSYLNFSSHSNVQSLRNKDLIDLIKNNEYYSGCYSVIQEKNLRGLDILNLSENTLTAWKLPQWQSKKLLSLKETLLKDPGSLKPEEEENPSDDPRKNISNTLTTIFKNKQKPKLPYKKHADDITPIKKEPDLNLIYDDDNYLKPQFNNSVKKPKNETKFDRPPLKFPEKSKSFSRSHDISSIPTRKPVALPRPDLNDEENEYEPPPSHNSRLKKPPSKLPLPPPPADETDEYEPPPRFGTKQPESTQEEDYEYIETKKDENAKSPVSKFYIDGDFPPPLPERSVLQKIEAKKWSFLPMYMNVDKAQSPTNAHVSSSTLPSNRTRKITPKSTQPISPVSDSKNSDTKATWSVLTRPLPPLPLAPASNKIVDEIENEESTYEDTEENSQIEELAEYGNVTESTSAPAFKSSNISELKLKTSRGHIDDLRSHLSNFKLRSSNPPRTKQSIFSDENKELKEILEKRHGSYKETNETMNNTKAKKDLTVLKSQMRLPLPPMSLPKSVQNTYFDEVIKIDQISHNDFGQNDIQGVEALDFLPEYLNTTDTQIPEPKHYAPPAANDSSSQKTKFNVKSKDIHLNDKLADELRILLEKRKGSNENVETGRLTIDQHYPRTNLPNKPIQNSTSNIGEIEDDDMDDFEQEDYDVAGSYSDMLNFNNEPFYRNTDRKGAIALLRDLEDGAFLLRPSRKFFLSITVKNGGKYFNLGIEKTPQNKIFCGEGMMRTREFYSLQKFLEHFEHNPLILQGERGLEEVYLKKVLPLDRF